VQHQQVIDKSLQIGNPCHPHANDDNHLMHHYWNPLALQAEVVFVLVSLENLHR
jgi:hypothetical protein